MSVSVLFFLKPGLAGGAPAAASGERGAARAVAPPAQAQAQQCAAPPRWAPTAPSVRSDFGDISRLISQPYSISLSKVSRARGPAI
ncbi:MAG: hypothetical protein J3K34DRAFT_405659 [Monoraphidium minutum]|nr:MAG: hypothetical protein J3K34DRAFT_405659 [Monoraphidium minutum]